MVKFSQKEGNGRKFSHLQLYKALCDVKAVKFSQIEGNGLKFSHIELYAIVSSVKVSNSVHGESIGQHVERRAACNQLMSNEGHGRTHDRSLSTG